MFNVFSTKENPTTEEGLKAFIKACYYGPDPNSAAYSTYTTPEETRQLLYMTMAIAIGSDMPEIQNLISGEYGLDGHGKFEDFVDVMLTKTRQEKDEDGNVIKTYSNMAELADSELIKLFDGLLKESINKSEEMYGKEYKDDYEKQFNNMKQNITKVREVISALFFYTENGYDVGKSIDNTLTLVQNAMSIAMTHFDEIYLALARTSNRYDDNYQCIKGDNQTINTSNNSNLSLTFDFDYYLFEEAGTLYIDGIEVPKDKYTISKGSTVITINASYLKTLDDGEHTIVAKINNKDAEAKFTASKNSNTNTSESSTNDNEKNPNTGDNIVYYISLLGISALGLISTGIYTKKEIFN
jgi:hypothetical protein